VQIKLSFCSTLWTLRKRLEKWQEGREGIKDIGGRCSLYLRKGRTTADSIRGWSSGQRSPLGSGGTLMKIVHESVSVQIAKQKARSYTASRKIKDWTFWRGRHPPKCKKELQVQREPVM
jgi:hypothetical protein